MPLQPIQVESVPHVQFPAIVPLAAAVPLPLNWKKAPAGSVSTKTIDMSIEFCCVVTSMAWGVSMQPEQVNEP